MNKEKKLCFEDDEGKPDMGWRPSFSIIVGVGWLVFIIIWLAGFLQGSLEKTTGELDIGVIIIIVLSLVLILFFLAITDLILREPEKARIRFGERIMSVLLFIITSAIILGGLGMLFWWRV